MTRGKKKRPAADRQRRFVEEYCKDQNATRAAIAAGYSKATAGSQGSRLLKNVKVAADIERIQAAVSKANLLTIEEITREVRRVALGDRRKLYDENGRMRLPHELDDETAALLAGTETEEETLYAGRGKEREEVGVMRKVKTKSWDKLRALEAAMSILGMHKSTPPGAGSSLSLSINLSGKSPKAA